MKNKIYLHSKHLTVFFFVFSVHEIFKHENSIHFTQSCQKATVSGTAFFISFNYFWEKSHVLAKCNFFYNLPLFFLRLYAFSSTCCFLLLHNHYIYRHFYNLLLFTCYALCLLAERLNLHQIDHACSKPLHALCVRRMHKPTIALWNFCCIFRALFVCSHSFVWRAYASLHYVFSTHTHT